MNKPFFFTTTFFTAALIAINSSSGEFKPRLGQKQPIVCGFKFAPVNDLKVTVKPISQESLRNRVDNERYEACPYNVIVSYGEISMHLEFSQDVNLERLKEVDQYGPLRTAYFQYDENGWESAGQDIEIKKDEISVNEMPDSLTVSGVVTRENRHTGKKDYCFSIIALGRKKYATGAVCRAERNQLNKIKDVFGSGTAIQATR